MLQAILIEWNQTQNNTQLGCRALSNWYAELWLASSNLTLLNTTINNHQCLASIDIWKCTEWAASRSPNELPNSNLPLPCCSYSLIMFWHCGTLIIIIYVCDCFICLETVSANKLCHSRLFSSSVLWQQPFRDCTSSMNNGDVLFPLMHWLPQLGHNFIDGLQDGSAKVPGPVYWPAMHIVWVVLGVFEGHLQRVWEALEAFTHLSKREDHSALI